MVFLKKNWISILLVFTFLIGLAFVYFNNTPPTDQVIYNDSPVSPVLQQNTSVNPPHTHDHNTKPVLNTSTERRNRDTYDWRDDTERVIIPKQNPWRQSYTQKTQENLNEIVDETDAIPRNWYKTKDPIIRAEYLHEVLIKQFGDIPEVHIIGEFEKIVAEGGQPTHNQYIIFLEAHYALWQDHKTLEVLKSAREKKEGSQ